MPFSLKQLELRGDSCIKKIQELKATVEDKGAEEIGNLTFQANGFFHGLFNMPLEEIDLFLSFFPRFPEILERSRQAANAEKRRRSFEEKIAKIKMEQVKKLKRVFEEEEKKTHEDADRCYWFWGRYITNNELNTIYSSPKQ